MSPDKIGGCKPAFTDLYYLLKSVSSILFLTRFSINFMNSFLSFSILFLYRVIFRTFAFKLILHPLLLRLPRPIDANVRVDAVKYCNVVGNEIIWNSLKKIKRPVVLPPACISYIKSSHWTTVLTKLSIICSSVRCVLPFGCLAFLIAKSNF